MVTKKLTEARVRDIRENENGLTDEELGKKYNVTALHIRNIRDWKCWK